MNYEVKYQILKGDEILIVHVPKESTFDQIEATINEFPPYMRHRVVLLTNFREVRGE